MFQVPLRSLSPHFTWGQMIKLKMNDSESVVLTSGCGGGAVCQVELGTIVDAKSSGQFQFTCAKDNLLEVSSLFCAIFETNLSERATNCSHVSKFTPRTVSQALAHIYGFEVTVTWLDLLSLVHMALYYQFDEAFFGNLYVAYIRFIKDDLTRSVDFAVVCQIHLDDPRLAKFMVVSDLFWKELIKSGEPFAYFHHLLVETFAKRDKQLPDYLLMISASGNEYIDYEEHWDARLLALIDVPDCHVRLSKRKRLDLTAYLSPSVGYNRIVDIKWRRYMFSIGTRVKPNESEWPFKIVKNKKGRFEDDSIKTPPHGLIGTIVAIDQDKRLAVVKWDRTVREIMRQAQGPGQQVSTDEPLTFVYAIGLKKTYHLDFAL